MYNYSFYCFSTVVIIVLVVYTLPGVQCTNNTPPISVSVSQVICLHYRGGCCFCVYNLYTCSSVDSRESAVQQ